MDFSLGEDRAMLADVLGRLLHERYDLSIRSRAAAVAPGYDPATWRRLAEVGAIGALFDAERGGFGGGSFDVIAVFEVLGSSLVAEPMLATLMAGEVLARAGSPALAALIDGSQLVAFAHHEPQSRYDLDDIATIATRVNDGWRIEGAKAVVLHAEAADAIIVSAWIDDAQALLLVPADATGLTVRGYATIDGNRAAEVTLAAVIVTDDALLLEGSAATEAIEAAVARATLALCAEALGVMEWLKDATLDYLRTRVQFGAPIGRNQALQHRMAELLIEIEQSRSAVINAAVAANGADAGRLTRALSAAKYTLGIAGTRVGEEAIQLHGGIGMTRELAVSHYAKRAIMIDHQLGDSDHHLGRYMALAAA